MTGLLLDTHIQVALSASFLSSHVPQPCAYQHERVMAVRKTSDNPRSASDFSIQPFQGIIRTQIPPVRKRKVIVRQGLFTTFGNNAGCPVQTQVSQLARHFLRFSGRLLPVLLGVDGLQHQAHPDLAPGRDALHIPVKRDCATLPAGI